MVMSGQAITCSSHQNLIQVGDNQTIIGADMMLNN